MKSFRWTLVFGLLAAGLAAFAVWDYKRSAQQEEQKEKDLAILKIKPDDVTRLELNANGAKTRLEKKDGKWQLLEPVQDSGDQQAILSLLSSMESEKTKETVVEGADVNWATYGLDKPVTTLKVAAADGREQTLKIGSIKAYDSNLYARMGEENKVLLVNSSWDSHLSKPAREFRDKRLFRADPAPAFDAIDIDVNEKDGKWSVMLRKVDGKWQVKGAKNPYPLAEETINGYIEQVKALRALDFIEPGKDDKGALAKHGLSSPGLKIRLQEGDKAPFEAKFSAPKGEEPNVHAVSSDLSPILSVYKTSVDTVKRREEDFYDKKVPFKFAPGEVGRVRIKTAAVDTEAVKEGNSWVLADKGLQKDLDSGKLDKMVGELARMEAVRILQPFKKGEAPKLKGESSVVFSKASGEKVFEFAWGEAVTEKAAAGRPEARYHPAWTSLTDRTIGVPEASVTALEIGAILKDKPAPSPSAAATPTANMSQARPPDELMNKK